MSEKMSLIQYLANLDSYRNDWAIWVNPDNVDDYIIEQDRIELSNYVRIGTLSELSFYGHSMEDKDTAAEEILDDWDDACFYGIDKEDLLEMYVESEITEDYQVAELLESLDDDVRCLCAQWAFEEAELFVENSLPDIISDYYL